MTAPLKPCPFCGGEPSDTGYQRWSRPVADTFWEDGSPITEAYFCNCIACGVTNIVGGVGYQTRDAAISKWNTRSDAPELVGLVEALREISTAPPHNTDGIIARAAIRTYEAMK